MPSATRPDQTEHAEATITVRGLSVDFGEGPVVDGIDLDIVPGELHVLFGPSGVGKSTVVSALSGSLPVQTAVSGSALLSVGGHTGLGRDLDLLRSPARKLRRQVAGRLVGTSRQAADGAFAPTMTILTQLRYAQYGSRGSGAGFGFAHPHRAGRLSQQLRDLAAATGLDPSDLGRYPHEFSGGQLSRLNLLAAMVNHPPVLLADEPTTGLDRDTADTVGALLSGYARSGHAVLVVTHDAGLARRWAQRVTRMSHGRVIATGTPEEMLATRQSSGYRPVALATGRVIAATLGAALRHRQDDVLSPTDLKVRAGEVVGLTGPSGVGKSSLAAFLALLEEPERGHVELEGQTLCGAGLSLPPAIRRRIGWISQHPRQAVDSRYLLRDIVILPARLAGIEVDADALVESLGLEPALLDRRPYEVSGGQLQRLCVARALALGPRLVVADEPFSMVDEPTTDLVLRRFRHAAEGGAGVLVISHDVHRLDAACDRVLHLHPGPAGAVLREVGPDAGERNGGGPSERIPRRRLSETLPKPRLPNLLP